MTSQSHLSLPPTPPPSPPATRRRAKKKPNDPFLDLPSPTDPASVSSSPSNEAPGEQESLITRIILTPLLFTSFLLSLFLVNRSDRARRAASHPSTSTSTPRPSNSLLTYFTRLTYQLNPEPYQDPSNSSWDRRDSASHVEPHSILNPDSRHVKEGKGKGPWFLRKKIRKVTRMEIGDAFEMRKRVLGAMVVVLVFAGLGAGMVVRWVVGWMWRWAWGE